MNSENPEPEQSQGQTESQRHPHLTVLQVFGLVVLFLVLQLLLTRLFVLSNQASLDDSHWPGISISHVLSGLITAKAGAILAGFSLVTLFMGSKFQFLLLLPLAVACCGITILASELGNVLHWIKPIPQIYLDFINQLFGQNFWGVLFTIGVVAPVVEELIFRGVILEGLQLRYNVKTAVVISSIFFGIIHILPHAIVNAVLLGFFFAWLKLQTGSLRLCMIAHALYNSIPLILSQFVGLQIPGFNTTPGETAQFQPWWLDLIGLVFLLLGIGGLRALYEPEPLEPIEIEVKS